MTAPAQFLAVHPILPTKDVLTSIDFYVQKLGFELRFQDSAEKPGYAGVARGNVEIHLQWHDPSEWESVERPQIRFSIEGVDSLFEEYRDKGVFHANTDLRDTGWGTREFAFFDPSMNGLVFFTDLS